MDKKQLYRQFCETTALPIQMQPFWLDTVCGPADWDVALAFDHSPEIIAALPFFCIHKLGFSLIKMPYLTDYIGPFIKAPESNQIKKHNIYQREQQLITQLVKQIPTTHFYYQQFYPSLTNWLPFKWSGFNQTTLFTYQISKDKTVEEAYQELRGNIRTNIKKAARSVEVERSNDLATFIDLNEKSFKQKLPFPKQVLVDLDQKLAERQARTIYLAKAKNNDAHYAGLYVVSDRSVSYFLLSGIDREYRSSAAVQLLYWEAVKDALAQGRSIDFCGSMQKGIEHLYRSFGAERVPYFLVYKSKNPFLESIALLFKTLYAGKLS